MSFVVAAPEILSAAATDLANIGSSISAANAAALAPTTGVLAAGADEVSAAIAVLFGSHAQALSAQAAAFHAQFVQTMASGTGGYASAEAANVQQTLLGLINAPTQTLLGRPLIGDGANGTTPGQNGGAGGILYGNGGNGAPGVNAGGAGGLIGHVGSVGAGGAGALGGMGGGYGEGGVGRPGWPRIGRPRGRHRCLGRPGRPRRSGRIRCGRRRRPARLTQPAVYTDRCCQLFDE